MSACSVIVNNKIHMSAIWEDGRPHYRFEDQGWYQIDPDPNWKARSGSSITANMLTGLIVVTVTGRDGNVYTFQQRPANPEGPCVNGQWGRYNRGGYDSVL